MKKLYISCPIKGRDWKDVVNSFKKMHKIAEIIFEEELEIVNSPRVTELKELCKSDMIDHFTDMSKADYFIGVEGCYNTPWKNCDIELNLAREFKIPSTLIGYEYIAEDCENMMLQSIAEAVFTSEIPLV